MLKMTFENVDDLISGLNKALQRTMTAKELMTIGESVRDEIVKRTRRGFGVVDGGKTGGNLKALKKLSDRYIDYRTANRSKLDSTTSPDKSNLTFSGQLLRRITVQSKVGSFTIRPSRKRRKGGVTDEDVALFQEDMGRVFLRIAKTEHNLLLALYEKLLSKEIRKR